MKHKYNKFQFNILTHYVPGTKKDNYTWVLGYYYIIYTPFDELIESKEYFETEQEAQFAAIGHIDSLEKGGFIEHD